jgi:hypothetical protein
MDKQEAQEILDIEINKYRSIKYADIVKLIDTPLNYEIQGKSGTMYQLEIQAFWDNPRKSKQDIRVIASIDDGGFPSAFKPLSCDFIIGSDGKFIGE